MDADFTVWANDDPVTLTGVSLRQDRFYGEPLALEGLVSSKSSALDSVAVTLRRADGEIAASAETSEPQRQVLLSRLARALNAQTLPVGSYVLTVEAQNAGGPTELMRQSISVSSDAISLCEFMPPVLVECGESVPINGVVASDATRLRCVGITVLNAQDRPVRQCAAVPDACVFDLSAFGGELLLSSLEAGEYRMLVFAENEHGYAVLYDSPLTVTRARDTITWEGERFSLGGRAYAAGEAVTLSGKLCSADSPLRSVTAEIVNADGEVFGTATLQTEAQECSVAALNQGLHTAALPVGEYSLTIRAENASGEYRVAFERFFVTECRHESVRSGLRYEPDCTGAGAICDSRCLFCGRSVRAGQLLPRTEHEMQDGFCKRCGAAAYRTVAAKLCGDLPAENGRYVLAACENNRWFALGKDGTAVAIAQPDVGGNISVGAELLWAAEEEQNGIVFRNADGMLLHLDRSGPSAAPGTAHTLLSCRNDADGLHLMLNGLQRSLAFEKGNFQTLTGNSPLFLFKMAESEY